MSTFADMPFIISRNSVREGAEHAEYEVGLTRQTNIDMNYGCLSTTNMLLQLASFGHSGTFVQMSEQNNRKKIQDCFPTSYTHHDHENPENMGEPHTYPVQLPFITISMYISTTKVKAHGEILVHKDQKLPKNLNGSNLTQIRLEMRV